MDKRNGNGVGTSAQQKNAKYWWAVEFDSCDGGALVEMVRIYNRGNDWYRTTTFEHLSNGMTVEVTVSVSMAMA